MERAREAPGLEDGRRENGGAQPALGRIPLVGRRLDPLYRYAWRLLRGPSLSRRIIASVALGLSLVLALAGVVALWTIQESTEAAYRERLAVARAVVWHVDRVLRSTEASLERAALELRLEPGGPVSEADARVLANLRLQLGRYVALRAVDARAATVWADPGAAAAAAGPGAADEAVRRAFQTGEPALAEVAQPGDADGALACLVVPVRDARGAVSGAVMADLDPADPGAGLLPAPDARDGLRIDLVDVDGRLLDGTDPTPGGRDAHRGLLADLMATRTAGYRVHEPPHSALYEAHVVAYAPVSLLPAWGILVEQPQDVVLAAPRALQVRLGLLGVAALVLDAAVAWFDVRRVVQPLHRLTAAAQRFAAGDLDEQVRLDRADELGILARAFDTMRQRLRASLAEVAEWNRELERRVAARTTEVERRNRELAYLNQIAETVSGTLDVHPMFERTLERVLAITGADLGAFYVLGEGQTHLALVAERGLPAALRAGHAGAKRCFCERAAALDRVVVLEGAELDTAAPACRRAGVHAVLAVPLSAGERVQGVLFLGSVQEGHFREVDLGTLTAVGRQVGMALANARLYESLQVRERERAELLQRVIAGQEEERRRLAQELHDEASQALASLQLGLDRLAAGKERPEDARRLAAQLQHVAAHTLADVHRLAVELRPSVLDDVGLVPALERYVRDASWRRGLAIDFAAVGVDGFRLIPPAETAVYRIVQGALTNVSQHAGASHVSVLLQRRHDKLVVVIEDDGRGFDLSAVRAAPLEHRLGMAGMEERAALIGATVTIETAPGAGTTVFLEVPLARNTLKEETHAAVGPGR